MTREEAAGVAERGFFARMAASAELVALLAPLDGIVHGWALDTQEPEDYPRISFFVVNATDAGAPEFPELRIQTDARVWPTQGGQALILQLDALLLRLFDEKTWSYEGMRLYGLQRGGGDIPNGAGNPLRRRRDYLVSASPLYTTELT